MRFMIRYQHEIIEHVFQVICDFSIALINCCIILIDNVALFTYDRVVGPIFVGFKVDVF